MTGQLPEVVHNVFRRFYQLPYLLVTVFFQGFLPYQSSSFGFKEFHIDQVPGNLVPCIGRLTLVMPLQSKRRVFCKAFIITPVMAAFYDIDVKSHRHKKAPLMWGFCGPDGTRTRDLCRDRAAF
jgi:hypothetical protein